MIRVWLQHVKIHPTTRLAIIEVDELYRGELRYGTSGMLVT
jgi:hypothetical protein